MDVKGFLKGQVIALSRTYGANYSAARDNELTRRRGPGGAAPQLLRVREECNSRRSPGQSMAGSVRLWLLLDNPALLITPKAKSADCTL